jgi:phosphoenolpyruvate carboxylase
MILKCTCNNGKVIYQTIYAEHLKTGTTSKLLCLVFLMVQKTVVINVNELFIKKKTYCDFKKSNIKAIFFDGRGGPPARGGGKTHKFYAH